MSDLHHLSIAKLVDGLQNQHFSSVELTDHFLKRINTLDKKVNSFITIDEEGARQAAQQADDRRSAGDNSVLLGLPMAHKDLFCTKGLLTTSGSKILHNFVSPYDATIVSNIREAGAV